MNRLEIYVCLFNRSGWKSSFQVQTLSAYVRQYSSQSIVTITWDSSCLCKRWAECVWSWHFWDPKVTGIDYIDVHNKYLEQLGRTYSSVASDIFTDAVMQTCRSDAGTAWRSRAIIFVVGCWFVDWQSSRSGSTRRGRRSNKPAGPNNGRLSETPQVAGRNSNLSNPLRWVVVPIGSGHVDPSQSISYGPLDGRKAPLTAVLPGGRGWLLLVCVSAGRLTIRIIRPG
jgi:hypothetical protein